MKIILASQSPQRFALMNKLDLAFEAVIPNFVEEAQAHLSPAEEALFLARAKAASLIVSFPQDLIIGADTLVACGQEKIGKPKDRGHAFQILSQLKGRRHAVITGVAIFVKGKLLKDFVETSWVTMKDYRDAEIWDYIATGEPMGKAGACSVQGLGRALIEKIEGDLDNIVGLPVKQLEKILKGFDFS
ncbi:MAG: septum formation protein Maf [Deltaproteobacteria bacterium]|nr:septum formation protein Maf [Deltaproteobacteria bacterium]